VFILQADRAVEWLLCSLLIILIPLMFIPMLEELGD
jgi:hypothetical protein